AVKGTGQGAIDAIVAAREGHGANEGQGGGPFRSLFDFALRVDRQRVNKRVVEALVKAGAFDALHGERAQLLASVGLAYDWAETQAANALQAGLFDFGDGGELHGSGTQEPALVHAAPWDLCERLGHEKAALGFHLSGHLFDAHRAEVRRFVPREIAQLADLREPQLITGIVGEVRTVPTARGRLVIFVVDDGSLQLEVSVDEAALGEQRALLLDDALVVLQGRTQPDRRGGGLRFNLLQLWDLPAARAHFGRYLAVDIDAGTPPVGDVLALWPARRVPGAAGESRQGLTIRLRMHRRAATAEIDLGDEARFWPCDEALGRWRQVAQGGLATIVYE
ncbi:MAG: DNA polymerase III subunit alpha, partial [Comamonadaceae bacterium]|nr:DNA polymerase III subunit alpha [Comamonadaceae bacterium]